MKMALLLILFSNLALAGEVRELSSPAEIEFLGTTPYSCAIFRNRLVESARAHAALAGLLKKLSAKKCWQDEDYQNLSAVLLKTGFPMRSLHDRQFRVHLKWSLRNFEEWIDAFNSPAPLPVSFDFKGWQWQDSFGVMPSAVLAKWESEQGIVSLQTDLTALEVCFGGNDLSLRITHPTNDIRLDLNAQVSWP